MLRALHWWSLKMYCNYSGKIIFLSNLHETRLSAYSVSEGRSIVSSFIVLLYNNRISQLTNDFVPLINVIRAREEHSATDHLAHDAAHRPYVHVLVVAHAQNDLGRPVVACDHVRRHHEGGACGARQSKVQDLQRAIRLDHDIGWLQILRMKIHIL